ncbi:MAG: class I fructose-bisphosphate aldolase [Bdellovibrionales bacterium]|nr:class I fructose-bisphosphate aldolase [Bdellovibrionales bacterium]
MTPQVRKVLGFYESENPGVVSNLARILNHGYLGGTGKLVILPVDQGFEHGPIPSFAQKEKDNTVLVSDSPYDPHYHFKLAITAGCNAYAAPLGFLQSGARHFAGEIPLILKVNNSDSLYKDSTAPVPALTSSVEAALQLGCAAVGFTIYPGSEQRKQMYEEIAQVSECAKECGLAVVIWAYPRGKGVSKQGETALDVVAYAAHIAAQLGAHIIKVKPPSDYIENDTVQDTVNPETLKTLSDRVRYIVKSAFNGRRMVIFSGGPAKEKGMFIQEIKELAKGGAFGSIVGRNAFKRPFNEAVSLLREIMDIYKGSD